MDLKSIKSKLSALQSQGQKKDKEKIDYSKYLWKPKQEGKYQIRIVPSKFDKNNPFTEVFVHYGFAKFPLYALTNWGEKDPIVEFCKQLKSTNDKESWSLARKLEPKMRVFAPVIVRGEEDKGVRLWEFGKEIYMQLLGIADDEDYGDYTSITDGRDFTLEAVIGDIGGKKGLKSTIRIKPKTSPLSTDKSEVEKWLEEQTNILDFQSTFKMSFDQMKGILQNWLNPEDETSDETENDETSDETESPFINENPQQKITPPSGKKSSSKKFEELFDEKD